MLQYYAKVLGYDIMIRCNVTVVCCSIMLKYYVTVLCYVINVDTKMLRFSYRIMLLWNISDETAGITTY